MHCGVVFALSAECSFMQLCLVVLGDRAYCQIIFTCFGLAHRRWPGEQPAQASGLPSSAAAQQTEQDTAVIEKLEAQVAKQGVSQATITVPLCCALVASSVYVWIDRYKLLELHVKRGHHCVAPCHMVLLLPRKLFI